MSKAQEWITRAVPDLSGKSFIVTGGNSGIGYEAARGLARKGARTVLACRNPDKARAAVEGIRGETPDADVEALELDLASLESVRKFADAVLSRPGELHGLLNNAGVMALPYCQTADGFEMQLGTNHLGHFALTGLLLPRLLATEGSRVVNLSSTAHKLGRMRFEDLQWRQGYKKWPAYGQSKLANLLFTYELQHRLAAKGASTIATACHPGYASTNLQTAGPRMLGSRLRERGMALANRVIAQEAEMGALPTLHAATSPEVEGGDYIGPGGFSEIGGLPRKVRSTKRSHDAAAQARLWEISEELTGVSYDPLR